MGKRTRDRQLAKAAAKRRAEQQARRRRRNLIVTGVVVAVLVAGAAVAFAVTRSGNEQAKSATPSPPPPVTPSPPPPKVACGAKQPADALTPHPQYASPPTMTIDSKATYLATMDTSCGKIVIRLDASQAPQAVNDFVFLSNNRFYDGTRFHRIANEIDIIQGGDPIGTGAGGPGYTTSPELTGKERYATGVLAMAEPQQPDSQGSQFFIVTGPKAATALDPKYPIFGTVVKGLDVAQKIQGLPVGGPTGDTPTQAIYIDTLRVQTQK